MNQAEKFIADIRQLSPSESLPEEHEGIDPKHKIDMKACGAELVLRYKEESPAVTEHCELWQFSDKSLVLSRDDNSDILGSHWKTYKVVGRNDEYPQRERPVVFAGQDAK